MDADKLMMKLSGKDDVLKLFEPQVTAVPDPCLSGPLVAEVKEKVMASKSKQRRMRATTTKRRMWLGLQECVAGDHEACKGSPGEVGEEAVELLIESKDDNKQKFIEESADLLFHFLILLSKKNIKLDEIVSELKLRNKQND